VIDDTAARTGSENTPWSTSSGHDDPLATLAHELRNLLAPLQAELAIVQRASGDPETIVERSTIMGRQLMRLARMIDQHLKESDPGQRGMIESVSIARAREGVANDEDKLRVLLVDDNRELTQSVTRFIRMLGHEIRVAFDGTQAVQLANEF